MFDPGAMEVKASELPSLELSDQSANQSTDKSSSASRDSLDNNDSPECSPGTPKPQPMAFTIDFGAGKAVDKSRLEHLAKQSQARHQRVQSMSASLHRPTPAVVPPQKLPLSAKLPRKAQGYNSEGYFSSDQEDSILSGSVKLRQSPLAQNNDYKHNFASSPVEQSRTKIKSPIDRMTESFTKIKSKSPIVDSIMSRSDTLPLRKSLNLPLNNTSASSYNINHDSPNYSNMSSSYQSRHLHSIVDQSPDGLMLTDISSPELDILTPDNALSSPEHKRSPKKQMDLPDLFKKCPRTIELEIFEDCDRHSDNSSTGTYTIEGDNYTEEQKARMSIDRTFGVDLLKKSISEALGRRSLSKERDPELVIDMESDDNVYRPRDICLRSPGTKKPFDTPKVSTEKNVLEISCCYESPTEDLAAQTSKQIKSTRNYLEKIKNRVRTISEKTFHKSPPRTTSQDEGSFTSVTTSGVLAKNEPARPQARRLSLTKSHIDQTDYVHHLTRESSVPLSLPSDKKPEEILPPFESSVLRNAQAKALRDDSGIGDVTPEQIVGKLSYLSLNRCKGDKTWIQEWADSVKKYNNDTFSKKPVDLNGTFEVEATDCRPPASPRHAPVIKSAPPARTAAPAAPCAPAPPSKIPSPVAPAHRSPRPLTDSPDTASYLLKTQCAISNLQAKLTRASPLPPPPHPLASPSRLPVSKLSRSNSLNYRLKKKDVDASPPRSPGRYVITGSGAPAARLPASRSLDSDANMNSPMNAFGDARPVGKTHSRHRSFDGRTDFCDVGGVSLKTVLNNALAAQHAVVPRASEPTGRAIDPTGRPGDGRHARGGPPIASSIRRSSSFGTVNGNNRVIRKDILEYDPDYLSDESDNLSYPTGKRQQGHNAYDTDGSYPSSQRHPEGRFKRSDLSGDLYTVGKRKSEPVYNRAYESDGVSYRDGKRLPEGKYKRSDLSDDSCPVGKRQSEPIYNRAYESDGVSYNDGKRHPEGRYKKSDLSDDSSHLDKRQPEVRYNRALALRRERLESPELRSVAPSNSPRCPSTPEVGRRAAPAPAPVRRISDETRREIVERLTKSRSAPREMQPKKRQDKDRGACAKPSQHRSSASLVSREQEFTNWRKRASYDPMRAAREGRMRRPAASSAAAAHPAASDLVSSSPVHRSQSFHSSGAAGLDVHAYSSDETEQEQRAPERAMITSTHSETRELRPAREYRETLCRGRLANFHVNPLPEKMKVRRDADKRRTFIIDDTAPSRDGVDPLGPPDMENTFTIDNERGRRDAKRRTYIVDEEPGDRRRTLAPDSDTNSTTNGSSTRNSSIFSHEKAGTSDTEGESGPEGAPHAVERHSGDFSVSSASTAGREAAREAGRAVRRTAPPARYLDISRYRGDGDPRGFLRRDASRAAVTPRRDGGGAAARREAEQKKAELEKWKRRASYDPRKSAALGKTSGKPAATTTSVLRSQSFHGPMLAGGGMSRPARHPKYDVDYTSDNDF